MTKISVMECQMEEGMRKAEAQRSDSHTHTLCPSRRLPPGLPSSWNENKHLLSLTQMNMKDGLQSHHTQNPRRPTQDLPRGYTDSGGHLTWEEETCVGGQ